MTFSDDPAEALGFALSISRIGYDFGLVCVSADLYLERGGEDFDGDEECLPEFLCPFCAEDFDVVGLCCHIDEEHPVEANNGVRGLDVGCRLFVRNFSSHFLMLFLCKV